MPPSSQSYYKYLPFLKPSYLSQEVSTLSQPILQTVVKRSGSLHRFGEGPVCLQAKTGGNKTAKRKKGEKLAEVVACTDGIISVIIH